MRLSLYLARVVFAMSMAALAIFTAVFAMVDLAELSNLAPESFGQLLRLYPLRLVAASGYIAPCALTIGVVVALARLLARGEWNAIRAAGVRPIKALIGLLLVPFAGVVVMMPLVFYLGPASQRLLAIDSGSSKDLSLGVHLGDDSEIWSVRNDWLVRASNGSIDTAIRVDSEVVPTFFLRAVSNGRYQVWESSSGFHENTFEDITAGGIGPDSLTLSMESGGPDNLSKPLSGPQLGLSKLLEVIERNKERGHGTAVFEAELALRVALIAACLLLPMLALCITRFDGEASIPRFIAKGLLAMSCYWLLVAAAWNGSIAGAWSSEWVYYCVVFLGIGALAGTIRSARLL